MEYYFYKTVRYEFVKNDTGEVYGYYVGKVYDVPCNLVAVVITPIAPYPYIKDVARDFVTQAINYVRKITWKDISVRFYEYDTFETTQAEAEDVTDYAEPYGYKEDNNFKGDR